MNQSMNRCFQLVKKDVIHSIALLRKLTFLNICINSLCGTLLNASSRSGINHIYFTPSSNHLVHLSNISSSWVTVDLPLIKPNCLLLKRLLEMKWLTILSLTMDSRTLHSTQVRKYSALRKWTHQVTHQVRLYSLGNSQKAKRISIHKQAHLRFS